MRGLRLMSRSIVRSCQPLRTLDASAQQVLNQGGLIYGGSALNLTVAGRIDNTSTGGAGQGI